MRFSSRSVSTLICLAIIELIKRTFVPKNPPRIRQGVRRSLSLTGPPGPGNEREPTMNQISAIEERSHGLQEGRTGADDVEYGRHAALQVKDPGDYHGKHRLEDDYVMN